MNSFEFKQQCRRRGNTDELVVEDVKLVVLEDQPEIVALMLQYNRQRSNKPWGFLLKKKDLPLVIKRVAGVLEDG